LIAVHSYCCAHYLYLPSFPTRRSSDLCFLYRIRQILPCAISRSGSRRECCICPIRGLYQSATYKAPSGPNFRSTGRKLGSEEISKFSTSFVVIPAPCSISWCCLIP